MEQDVKLLPIAEVGGREFLIDEDNRELRDFNDPGYVVKMHSQEGKELIKQMQEMEFNCMGISTGANKGMEV